MQNLLLLTISLLFMFMSHFTTHWDITKSNVLDKAKAESLPTITGVDHKENGDTTVVEIRSEGIELSYSVTEITAKAGDILLIRYTNESDMSHNIVLVGEETDIRPVGIAALQAMGSDWIPESEMDRIIAFSELAYSGDIVEFSFKVPPPGTYPYICTYSAHWTQMQGRLISTE